MPAANIRANEGSIKIKETADPMSAEVKLIFQSWAIVARIINSRLDSEISSEILARMIKVESENEEIKS